MSNGLNQFDVLHCVIYPNTENDVKIISTQKGVFRNNCVDCLDRTNVVQTVLARQMLHQMLYRLKISEQPNGEPFETFNPVFEASFKRMWADHGDYLSHCYSGTGALKSDFVRTGKRTKKGALQDGVYTSKRFYLNNFCDGYNQDCHDYFLKDLNPKKNIFKQHSTSFVNILIPSALILTLVIYNMILKIALPDVYEDSFAKMILRLLLFIGVCYFTIRTIFSNVKKMIISLPTIDHF